MASYRFLTPAVVSLLAVASTTCSSGSDGWGNTDEAAIARGSEHSIDDMGARKDKETAFPLRKYISEAGEPNAIPHRWHPVNAEARVQNLIATCMKQRGFDYIPWVPESGVDKQIAQMRSLSEEEAVEKYGYGITTIKPRTLRDIKAPEETDPNVGIRRRLPPRARQGYERALHGGEGARRQGCEPAAKAAVYQSYGEYPEASGPLRDAREAFSILDRRLELLRERIARDPRVVRAVAQWSDCMAASGYPGLHGINDGPARISESEATLLEAKKRGTTELIPEGRPRTYDELEEYETLMARADLECRQQHYDDVRDKVAHELESEFVAKHHKQLERFRSWFTPAHPAIPGD